MNLDDKCERLAELEILVKQGEIGSGESRHSISKLNQEIELLQDQIDDLEKKESTNTKLIDQKVFIFLQFEIQWLTTNCHSRKFILTIFTPRMTKI